MSDCIGLFLTFYVVFKVIANREGHITFPHTSKPFSFLRLPVKIRNKIYQLLLLTENVATRRPAIVITHRIPGEGEETIKLISQWKQSSELLDVSPGEYTQ